MEFNLSAAQEAYRKKVLEFAAGAELDKNLAELDARGEFNLRAWKLCAEFGIQGGLISKEFGGQGLELVTYIAGLEALGEACSDNGLLVAMCAQIFACELPIAAFGSAEQKKKWLPALCSGGKIAAIAIAEEQGASDAFSLQTVAARRDGGYVINGRKCFITNAPFCDMVLVFARLEHSAKDVVCLVVDASNPGLKRLPPTKKMGLRSGPFGELVLDNCVVPEESRLGSETSGKLVFMAAMEWERGCLLAPIVGAMQRQLEQCIKRVRERKQGGQSISRFQAVSHRIVDMKMRVELARMMLHNFAWKKQTRRRANLEASMTKLYISESFVQNTLDAMQLHGGYGYTCDSGVERQLRDAVATRIASGTSDVQKNIIAEWLRL
ncbi:MAG: acyl-CoA dehydrogenase [Verrucomicrobia bacterium]|nr:acyl-CoA dehydrogenase [Verrucomicrobiota bacterium]